MPDCLLVQAHYAKQSDEIFTPKHDRPGERWDVSYGSSSTVPAPRQLRLVCLRQRKCLAHPILLGLIRAGDDDWL